MVGVTGQGRGITRTFAAPPVRAAVIMCRPQPVLEFVLEDLRHPKQHAKLITAGVG
ncbi:hypothetical protein CBM2589_B120322 [Cupriavidus taiwanensis]|uniref:Uncharacterized protein n=1 Tax=Cupriavidus taiwanensis TaxID=164546 RepID=A0A375BH22_9BURK|nr:hypothetical protein CBM2589_B120322 [Cupriavidus taiwanensis]